MTAGLLSMKDSNRRIFYPVSSRILAQLLIAHEIIMGDTSAILAISLKVGNADWHKRVKMPRPYQFLFLHRRLFWCTILRLAIRADLRFNHYLSVTAIGGFCDGIHGVIQGIAGGDNGT